MRRLEVEKRQFNLPDLDGLYTEHPVPAGFACRADVSDEEFEALLVEAECYFEESCLEDGRMFCFSARAYENMDRTRLTVLKRHILEKRPEWVQNILYAARMSSNIYVLISLSDVQPYPGVAIVERLQELGVLPPLSC
jgi:hypothetical protein